MGTLRNNKGISGELRNARGVDQGGNATLIKGVVQNYFLDRVEIPDVESAQILLDSIQNPDYVCKLEEQEEPDEESPPKASLPVIIPRNSILVRMTSPNEDSQPLIAYPLFPPHMCMPAKPGETVFLIRESADKKMSVFWLARVPGTELYDDINRTHEDRKLSATPDKNAFDKFLEALGAKDKYAVPSYENGTGVPGSPLTLGVKDEKDYLTIISEFEAKHPKIVIDEPVPRFTKRPGDLVLQGSNNALISLGMDRGWKDGENPASTSNAYSEAKPFSGTVDIVAGRGRYHPAQATNTKTIGDSPERTAAPTITSTRDIPEVDKNLFVNGLEHNPVEGDPDFMFDSSRIYTSMKTSPDINFGLTKSHGKLFEGEISPLEDVAAIVIKSDHLRFVARKQDAEAVKGAPEINGSIQIIKEDPTGETAARIIIQPDGSIHISGNKLFLADIEKSMGGGEGPKGSEPYMRFSDFKAYMDTTLDKIKSDMDALSADIGAVNTAFTTAVQPPAGPYAAPGTMVVASPYVKSYVGTDTTGQKGETMDPIKSTLIFGD